MWCWAGLGWAGMGGARRNGRGGARLGAAGRDRAERGWAGLVGTARGWAGLRAYFVNRTYTYDAQCKYYTYIVVSMTIIDYYR